MGTADICMVFLLNVYSNVSSMLWPDWQHMGIADIYMVCLLNEFSYVFSDVVLDW